MITFFGDFRQYSAKMGDFLIENVIFFLHLYKNFLNKNLKFFAVLFSEGDPVQFEAVPQEGNADDPASRCLFYESTFRCKFLNIGQYFINNLQKNTFSTPTYEFFGILWDF
jgi:hypothetical protein